MPRNLLFVCARNQWRSPTAEQAFRNRGEYAVRSAGVSPSARRRITLRDIEWADVVLAMEHEHAKKIKRLFGQQLDETPILVLDIPDDYQYMDPELVELLEDRVAAVLSGLEEQG